MLYRYSLSPSVWLYNLFFVSRPFVLIICSFLPGHANLSSRPPANEQDEQDERELHL